MSAPNRPYEDFAPKSVPHGAAMTALVAAAGRAEPPEGRFVVPGRIELLGKHTDYAGGMSLTCASSRGIRVAAWPRSDDLVCLYEPDMGRYAALEIGRTASAPPGHWTGYAAAVIRRLAQNVPGRIRGTDLWLSSNLPRASGMSSSSAFMIAVFLGLDALADFRQDARFAERVQDPEALAGYLSCVENGSAFQDLEGERGVGTAGGSEDHTAILLSRERTVGRYRYAPFEHMGRMPLPDGLTLIVAASGVKANKTGSARADYNRASALARVATEAWNQTTGQGARHLADVLRMDPDAGNNLAEVPETSDENAFTLSMLRRRLEHFRIENDDVIPAAWSALERGDLAALGAAVERSQDAAEDLLGNQVPETSHLVRSARQLGAVAASAFGAGFGGAVWALVPGGRTDEFVSNWRRNYSRAFPRRARRSRFFAEPTGPGAVCLDGHPVW